MFGWLDFWISGQHHQVSYRIQRQRDSGFIHSYLIGMLLMLFGIYLHQYAQCNLFFIQHDDDQNDGLRAQNQPASMAQNPDLSLGVIFLANIHWTSHRPDLLHQGHQKWEKNGIVKHRTRVLFFCWPLLTSGLWTRVLRQTTKLENLENGKSIWKIIFGFRSRTSSDPGVCVPGDTSGSWRISTNVVVVGIILVTTCSFFVDIRGSKMSSF